MGQGQFAVILPAAGKSSRFGDPKQKKIYSELDGRAVWLRAVEPFVNRDDVAQIIMAIAAEDREMFERRYRASVAFMNIKVIDGGPSATRTSPARSNLSIPECEYVAIHDAARPCLSHRAGRRRLRGRPAHGAALLAVPVADTIKRVGDDHLTTGTVPREGLYLAQTPQVFRRDLLFKAYAQRSRVAGTRHRRLPARRGPGPALRDRGRLATQYQDHDASRSEARRGDPAASRKAQARILGPSLLRPAGHVVQFAQAKAI